MTHATRTATDLTIVPEAPIGRAESPLPTFSGGQMVAALAAYRELQVALDRAMPDGIIEIEGRRFRKKAYWRAIATAFNLNLDLVEEQRKVAGTFEDHHDNFGYIVSYRATAPNGRSTTGDGACFAVEKARRFKCPHPHSSWKGKAEHWPPQTCPAFDPHFQWRALPGEATEHNVRSHATTRAMNRAISNLVAFGEVSAEEVDHDHDGDPIDDAPPAPPARRVAPPAPARDTEAPSSAVETVVVPVLGVITRPLKNGNEKFVISAGGHTYQTFSATLAKAANSAREASRSVTITFRTTQYGREVVALADAPEAPR